MTLADMADRCVAAENKGHEWLQFVLTRKRAPRCESVRLWRGGPSARYVGWIRDHDHLVDVKVADLRRALTHAGELL